MCGIVGAISERKVSRILLEGLKRLEYRGYDSAGIALLSETSAKLQLLRSVGKVKKLSDTVIKRKLQGDTGIAHTCWATHGKPSVSNAHPHSSQSEIAIVHNGIIENHESLRSRLAKKGYEFKTETDSEVIAHLIHQEKKNGKVSLLDSVMRALQKLNGAYGICAIDNSQRNQIIVARSGSPIVIGVGIGENFIASDPLALGHVTDRFIYLEEGDIAQVTRESIEIWNGAEQVSRPITTIDSKIKDVQKGEYKHFMLKEIYEQPVVVKDTLDGRITARKVLE